jgi:hypothetical protein
MVPIGTYVNDILLCGKMRKLGAYRVQNAAKNENPLTIRYE